MSEVGRYSEYSQKSCGNCSHITLPLVHCVFVEKAKVSAIHFFYFLANSDRNSQNLGEDDQEFLQKFDSSMRGLSSLRNFLHFALGMTPLCLLLPYDWSKVTLNWQTLIEVSSVLFLYSHLRSTTLSGGYFSRK